MIYKLLDVLFFIASWVLLGMGLALFFYRNHLCCDKDADMWYYIGFGVFCFIVSCLFCFTRKDEDKDA